jgi:hypothetical protein
MRLHHNLVNCRRALIDAGQLKKPGDDAGGAKFFKNTLRRLSVRKMEKYRAEALANEQVRISGLLNHVLLLVNVAGQSHELQ